MRPLVLGIRNGQSFRLEIDLFPCVNYLTLYPQAFVIFHEYSRVWSDGNSMESEPVLVGFTARGKLYSLPVSELAGISFPPGVTSTVTCVTAYLALAL